MKQTAKCANVADWSDSIVESYAEADGRIAADTPLGPHIPFKILSDALGGYWPIGLVGIHAGPGTGKTAFAVFAALAVECPTIYLTCEMSAETIIQRMIASTTGDFLGRLRRGQISAPSLRAKLDALGSKYPGLTIIDASSDQCDFELVQATVLETGTQVLFVDSIHAYTEQAHPLLDEYPAMNRAVRELRALAIKRNIPVVLIQERSRAQKNGGLHAAAGTRKLEYSAEVVLELDIVDGGTERATRVNLTVSKNRQGPRGVIIGYEFDGAVQRFREIGPAWSGAQRPLPPNDKRHTADMRPVIHRLPTVDEYFDD